MYVSVTKKGNNIHDVYYDDKGKKRTRKVKYKPSIYIESFRSNNDVKTLFGKNTHKIQFDALKEFNEYVWKNKKTVEIQGNIDPVYQYIRDVHSNSKVKLKLKTWAIDIEVFAPEFPDPKDAKYEINSVAIKDFKSGKYLALSLKDYDPKINKVDIDPTKIKFRKCESEVELLESLLTLIKKGSPDVLVGWYSAMFDFPYIINRMKKILGNRVNELSPFGNVSCKTFKKMNSTTKQQEDHFRPVIDGIILHDYMELYKKYIFTPRASYGLDFIAQAEKVDGKVDYSEYDTLGQLWIQNPQKYIDYNLVDVKIIFDLDKKLDLLELNSTITYKARCNHLDTLGTIKVWESFLYNEMLNKNICLPARKDNKKETYPGAYVKDPICGVYGNNVSFDFDSLYPLTIRQYNISPETFISDLSIDVDQENVDECFFKDDFKNPNPEYILTASGNYFKKDKPGIVPNIIEILFAERKQFQKELHIHKKELTKIKDEMKTCKSDDLIKLKTKHEQLKAFFHNNQMAIKILLNSLYGAMANKYFVFYDIRFARSITLSAQLATLSVERHIENSYLKKKLNISTIYCDTDSAYLNVDNIVQKCITNKKLKNDDTEICNFIDRLSDKKITPIINEACMNVSNKMNSFNYMNMKREKISKAGLWIGKKKYALYVLDNEGDRYTEPELKVTGIQYVSSGTPAVIKPFLKECLIKIIKKDNLYEYIRDCKKEYQKFTPEEISFPKSANNFPKWIGKKKLYKKGTPIAVKSALIFNKYIDDNDLESEFTKIKSGDKIKFIYIKKPNVLSENTVGFLRRLPDDLKKFTDRKMMWEKSFMNIVTKICDQVDVKYEKEQDDINNLF